MIKRLIFGVATFSTTLALGLAVIVAGAAVLAL